MTEKTKRARNRYREALRRIEQARKSGDHELNLARLGLETLPPEIGQLTKLTTLNLCRNQLSVLPPEIGRLTKLRALQLYNNHLSALPPEIGQLTKLYRLQLHNNYLSALPPEVGQFTRLTRLDLNNNQLSALPPEIGQLTELQLLELNSNLLSVLPSEIGQLTQLTRLDLHNNQLSALPSEIGQLAELRVLTLLANQLSTLPPEIGQLTKLKGLYLRKNHLRALPSEIGQLTELEELWLEYNRLSTLLPEIGQLAKLWRLHLHYNQLNALPPEIGRLRSLETLTLDSNNLQALPDSLRELHALKELTLHSNESLALPAEVLGPEYADSDPDENPPADPRAVLDYYFARQVEGEEAMREVRLLLVGRGRVGKTSLLKALRGIKPDEAEPETPGITVETMDFDCENGIATAHAWDFGGQEFLHSTHQIFLAERCVYLLVLEGRASNWESETDYWLRFIQSFGGESPVIVILTKYAEHPFSVDRFRLEERCQQIAGFVETDAFTGMGVEDLRGLLAETVNGMRDVWLPLPRTWHRVKQSLTEMPENFLEYGRYQEICQELGVADEGKQDSLAQSLHRLGIALNFREHHRLRDTSVLKPEWVTDAIYGLIRYVQKQDCHGVMQLAWMAEALNPDDYPTNKHAFVLELMEKFEVAFALEGTQEWLIPELLREEQPAAFEDFRKPGGRRLRFSYPEALPPGLLPRLIVRTHEMSAGHPDWRWRSGVVLAWQGARALVRLNRMERRTEVAVIDDNEDDDDDRQSLFDLIRAHLIVLHGRVRVFEEVELGDHPDSWVRVGKLRKLEEKGTTETEEDTREGELATVRVSETLDRVESPEARAAERPDAPRRMRLFVSYAHDDAKQIAPLSKHLTILGRRGYIQVWDDRQLIAGEVWEDRILEELERADIVLLVYSNSSRASGFIQEKEGPRAVERAKSADGPCSLIVVPLDRDDWDDNAPLERDLKKLQTATWNAKPVLEFDPERKGWLEVEQSIRKAVELRRQEMGGRTRG